MNLIDVVELSKKHCEIPIDCELVYATPHNFVGRVLDGYQAGVTDVGLLTSKAAHALCLVQNHLIKTYKLGLLIYDAYRPQRTIKDFVKWANALPASQFELDRKLLHYPHIEKNEFFKLGYVAEDSNHCYGNTVDVFLMDIETRKPLDMGAIFDFMDPLSHLTVTADDIGVTAYQNRQILILTMEKFGFHSYKYEFWHYVHGGRAGAEVTQPLDIEITADLKGVGVHEMVDKI
jgi:D-alanyl-D-alanine dipeptidase